MYITPHCTAFALLLYAKLPFVVFFPEYLIPSALQYVFHCKVVSLFSLSW